MLKKTAGRNSASNGGQSSLDDDASKAVAATVAQIFAETAELNSQAKINTSNRKSTSSSQGSLISPALTGLENDSIQSSASPGSAGGGSASPSGYKYEAITSFNPGSRLEAQDFDGVWHSARIVEVDNGDGEVLIRFERVGRQKTAVDGSEEWIPMNSHRLRQKVSTRPILVFELEERCLARWSGPRKFPATVKKILPNDTYEVLFDDGYSKNVRALHMNKLNDGKETSEENSSQGSDTPDSNSSPKSPFAGFGSPAKTPMSSQTPPSKKRSLSRKDWPLMDLTTLDLGKKMFM